MGAGIDTAAFGGLPADLDASLSPAAPFGADFASGAGTDTAPAASDTCTRAWRLALARAARDQLKLTIGFSDVALREVSLTEVLETPMQRALILMLQGRGEGMGLLILSGQMLAAMIEMLTLTRLSSQVPDAADLRKPTRTDAAMAVEFVDAAMAGFEAVMAESGGAAWSAGYRYAAFIDDPRPLHLMLEDGDYHLLTCDLALEDGMRTGTIALALPKLAEAAEFGPDLGLAMGGGLGGMEFSFDQGGDGDGLCGAPQVQEDSFTADLAHALQDMPIALDAALTQISVPLDRLMRLQVGEVLALPLANLDNISVTGLDGRRVAGARLGQNRGMRALRLTDMPQRRVDPAHPPAAAGHATAVPAAQASVTQASVTLPAAQDFTQDLQMGQAFAQIA